MRIYQTVGRAYAMLPILNRGHRAPLVMFDFVCRSTSGYVGGVLFREFRWWLAVAVTAF
jgi:hypothetical protein